MPQKTLLWLDCDPGIDDTMAIILAANNPSLHLLGLSACQGNSILEHTSENCLKILNAIGRLDIPVISGSQHPFAI
jgi:inosine-uridine nucleoside N-ribohydrolase